MKRKQLTALFAAVLGLGMLAGCKDIFHSEESDDNNNTVTQVTITYSANGGTGTTPSSQTIGSGGGSVTLASGSGLTRSGYTFGGWMTGSGDLYYAGGSYSFSSNITLYANWTTATLPSDLSLAQSLAWITSNAIEGGNYTITLKNNETIAPQSLSYGKNVNITLNGGASERYIILGSSGSLFTVGNGVTLTLDNNITLQGRSSNTDEIVYVGNGGRLVMKDGAKITGNTAPVYGSGVGVYSGTFVMDGGTISDNYITNSGGGGAGVYLWPSSSSSKSVFTMNGGIITNNISEGRGAGVLATGSDFTMNGGTISNNTAGYGGGICSESNTYYPYEATYTVTIDGTFTMNGGTISGNTAGSNGGGVYISSGTFTMSAGTISGNTAASYGGGVYVYSSGTFTKQSGGTIYGSNASSLLKNTANGDSYGHAVYVSSSPAKKRNSTAGSSVTLNSGSSSGWE